MEVRARRMQIVQKKNPTASRRWDFTFEPILLSWDQEAAPAIKPM
jgi:hypothetical protein